MNKVVFTGYMVGKPEIEYTGTGLRIAKFEVLNKVGWGKYEANNRMKCVAFSSIAQVIHDYFQKGDPIFINAEYKQVKRYEKDQKGNKHTAEIEHWFYVESIEFMNGKNTFEMAINVEKNTPQEEGKPEDIFQMHHLPGKFDPATDEIFNSLNLPF